MYSVLVILPSSWSSDVPISWYVVLERFLAAFMSTLFCWRFLSLLLYACFFVCLGFVMLSLRHLILILFSVIFLFCVWDCNDCDQGQTPTALPMFSPCCKSLFSSSKHSLSQISFVLSYMSQKPSSTKSLSSLNHFS